MLLDVTILGLFSKQQGSARLESTPKLLRFVRSAFESPYRKNSPNFTKVEIDRSNARNFSKKLPTMTQVIYHHSLCPKQHMRRSILAHKPSYRQIHSCTVWRAGNTHLGVFRGVDYLNMGYNTIRHLHHPEIVNRRLPNAIPTFQEGEICDLS